MYNQVFKIALEENLRVCCEVNEKPLNEISLAFHKRHGFQKTHEKKYAKKKVAFLEKPPFVNGQILNK
jgi:predicted GNAT superfamily acetyltransferase